MTIKRGKKRSTLPGPDDVTRVELPNGIVVLTRSNFDNPSVVMNGYLGSGSMFDPDDQLGLAHFTSLSLMRGTQKHTFQEIFDTLESIGASMGLGASVHNTSFASRALAEDLPVLLGVLAEVLRMPVFPKDQVERLRAQILTGLAIRAQDTSEMASLIFDQELFSGHPYGRPEDGYTETIQRIHQHDLVNFHHRLFGPQGMVVVVVGAVTAESVIELVNETLGDWCNPEQIQQSVLPSPPPVLKKVKRHMPIQGKSQTDLLLGCFGPRRCSPDYLPASLGNNILGQFGMMGRIGDVVRQQAGLAYYASASLNAWIAAGSWEVSAGVNPVNVDRAIDLILKELGRFVGEPVSKEELSDSQSNYIGRLPISLESNAGVASALLNLERFQLGLEYYRNYPHLVENVTLEMVLETAKRYLDPDRLVIISAGPEAS